MAREEIVEEMLYVEVHLGMEWLTAFYRWQTEQRIYPHRTFTTGGPSGFFSGVFRSEFTTRVRDWLREHGIEA